MVQPASDDRAPDELETCRKALIKSKPDDLRDGALLSKAFIISARPWDSPLHLKQLELIMAILRQAIVLLSQPGPSTDLLALTHDRIAPALHPGGHWSALINLNLEHSQKMQQSRAADVLAMAGKLATVVPSSTAATSSSSADNFMVPFFRHAISSGISRRSTLAIITALLPSMPRSVIPETLLAGLLQDLVIIESALLRCNLIVDLLLVQAESTTSSEEGVRAVLSPLVPFFDPSAYPQAVLNNLNRYLLPALFKAKSSYVNTLLDMLAGRTELFATWVSVASIGVSLGLVQIGDLPQGDLHDALGHEDADVRLRAFELVSGTKSQFSAEAVELIKESLVWNASPPSAGARSTLSSATYAFLVRLHQLETSTHRIHRKKLTPAVEAERAAVAHILPLSTSFRYWFLTSYLEEGLHHARRPPVSRILLTLNLLERYLEVFGDTGDTQVEVFTASRVDLLLACQMSEFTEVRSRARSILESAKVPLPGYEDLSTPKARALLSSAEASLNLPRKTQAEAGKSALCILFAILARNEQEKALAFVTELVDRLERGVEAVERDLAKGIEQHPLHGSLAAIGDLLRCLDLSSVGTQNSWKSNFHRLFSLIDRIWAVTRTVISLAPAKLADAADGSRPDHEIARAYEVLASEDAEGDEEDEMDHTGLLSGCWRATRNAGELLATMITRPITQGGASQNIWSQAEVDRAGKCFLVWLHEIRHRGTFSKIANAFGQVAETVRPDPELRRLCEEWLQHELGTIASDEYSTTRRSAALPYSILALVSSDKAMLDTALTALLELARVDNNDTTNITKVHAFNVLKIVLLDAKQSKVFSQWFEKGVLTALGAFESPDWNVRNVGLILFSTLVHRCLSPPRGGQDYYRSRSTLALRTSYSAFHAKYPLIIPYITEYLRQHGSDTSGHSPLFPILIIVRSLRWSEDERELQDRLELAVKPYLSSKEYQVRRVAAQALLSLIPPTQALIRAASLTSERTSSGTNAIQGDLLLLNLIIRHIIPWGEVSAASLVGLEQGLKRLVGLYVPGSCSPIAEVVLSCANEYLTLADSPSTALLQQIRDLLASCPQVPGPSSPGIDMFQSVCTDLLLAHASSERIALQLLASTEDNQISALKRLVDTIELSTPAVLKRVLDLATSGSGGLGVQAIALDVLAEAAWPEPTLRIFTGCWTNAIQSLEAVSQSRCVPVGEAALVALGWAVSRELSTSSNELDSVTQVLSDAILIASHEDESQPTRYAAYRSLSHLGPWLFEAANPHLIRSLLRLVQDDDEEIRMGAADIVTTGLGQKRGVVQEKAVDMLWNWISQRLPQVVNLERDWITWIRELAQDRKGVEHDARVLAHDLTTALFEVEASNIFRDPLVDVRYGSRALAAVAISVDKQELDPSTDLAPSVSPIDDAWEAKRTITRRSQLQDCL